MLIAHPTTNSFTRPRQRQPTATKAAKVEAAAGTAFTVVGAEKNILMETNVGMIEVCLSPSGAFNAITCH